LRPPSALSRGGTARRWRRERRTAAQATPSAGSRGGRPWEPQAPRPFLFLKGSDRMPDVSACAGDRPDSFGAPVDTWRGSDGRSGLAPSVFEGLSREFRCVFAPKTAGVSIPPGTVVPRRAQCADGRPRASPLHARETEPGPASPGPSAGARIGAVTGSGRRPRPRGSRRGGPAWVSRATRRFSRRAPIHQQRGEP